MFPLHPHEADDPFTNRQHNARERRAGEDLLQALIVLLRPARIIAIGNDAAAAAKRVVNIVPVVCVRHPSYGGQTQFLRQIAELYDPVPPTNSCSSRLLKKWSEGQRLLSDAPTTRMSFFKSSKLGLADPFVTGAFWVIIAGGIALVQDVLAFGFGTFEPTGGAEVVVIPAFAPPAIAMELKSLPFEVADVFDPPLFVSLALMPTLPSVSAAARDCRPRLRRRKAKPTRSRPLNLVCS